MKDEEILELLVNRKWYCDIYRGIDGLYTAISHNIANQVTALSKDENRFMTDISAVLQEGRATAYAAVNFAMTATYWKVGKRIVEQEQHGKERGITGNIF
ncbi:MAG: hypothetical protein LBG27_01860 [Spirochaetaceae bacterium]|nr:hypothetical protein [Spirochaetaceae bacterium]